MKCKYYGYEIEKIIQKIPAKNLEWGEICEKELNWEDAKKWCKQQGNEWRLPTVVELLQAHNDNVIGFGASYYWSSTESSEAYALNVTFSSGSTSNGNKAYTYSVRCVRNI